MVAVKAVRAVIRAVVEDTLRQLVLFECPAVDLVAVAQAAMVVLEATEHLAQLELYGV
jgi:hypothetical protein